MTRAEAGTSGTSGTLPRSRESSAPEVSATSEADLSCQPSGSAQKSGTGASGKTRESTRAAAQGWPTWRIPMNCMEKPFRCVRAWCRAGSGSGAGLPAEEVDGGGGRPCSGRGTAVGLRPHVVRLLDQKEFDGGTRAFQRLGERGGLGCGDEAVSGSVGQEEGGSAGMHVRDGAGCGGLVRCLRRLGAEKECLP